MSELSEHRRNQKFQIGQIGSGITKNWNDWAELYIDEFWIWKELKPESQKNLPGLMLQKTKSTYIEKKKKKKLPHVEY